MTWVSSNKTVHWKIVTKQIKGSDLELTKDASYLVQLGTLLDIYCEYSEGKKWNIEIYCTENTQLVNINQMNTQWPSMG